MKFLVCFGTFAAATNAPIPIRLTPDGLKMDGHIEGFEPQEYFVELGAEISQISDTWTQSVRLVHLSPELTLGPTTVYEYPRDDPLIFESERNTIGIGIGSAFFKRVHTTALVPYLDGALMYTDIEDPSWLCERFIYRDFDRNGLRQSFALSLSADVSLIPNPMIDRDVRTHGQYTHVPRTFRLSLSSDADIIPRDLFEIIMRELRILEGGLLNRHLHEYYDGENFYCENFVDSLPSIRFTINNDPFIFAHNHEHTEPIRIVLEPREYVDVDPVTGVCKLRVKSGNDWQHSLTFGRTILRNFALHIDHDNMRIGFCDMREHAFAGLK